MMTSAKCRPWNGAGRVRLTISPYQKPRSCLQQIPPAEYSPFTTTAVVLRALRLYPILGRREEFQERFRRAKNWLLAAKAAFEEERSMQLVARPSDTYSIVVASL